jgi:hypothetical protein
MKRTDSGAKDTSRGKIRGRNTAQQVCLAQGLLALAPATSGCYSNLSCEEPLTKRMHSVWRQEVVP